MTQRTASTICTLLFVFVLNATSLNAQKNNANQRDERRENERVAKAEKSLREVKQDLEKAQKETRTHLQKLNSAQDAVQKAKRNLREAEEAAEEELGEKAGIPTALKRVKDAAAQKQAIADPILAQLRTTDAWKLADQQATTATEQKSKLRDNESIDENVRKEEIKKLDAIINRPFQLEQQTISSNPICAKAIENLTKLQNELTNLRKSISRDEVASHPKVVKAKKALETQESSLKSMEKEFSSSQTKLNKVQEKFQSAERELNKARAADAADSNRNKRGGK